MASEALPSLAADFEPATDERWRALVDKVLKGRSFDDVLGSRTLDGIDIQPLYTRDDVGSDDPPSAARRGRPFEAWDVRQRHGHPDPAVTNDRILRDLERGATSIELLPVGMATRADLARALEGVMFDLAPVALRPGPDYMGWAGALLQVLADSDSDPATTRAMVGADPLGVAATHLMMPWPIESGLAQAADLAVHLTTEWPGVRGLRADGAPYHNAGGSDAQELAYVVASLVTYLRALESVGLGPAEAAGQINLVVVATADQFLTIAKVRALRVLVERVFESCGAAAGASSVEVDAITSAAMMTSRDPWVNMLRTTVACFGAAVAGVDSVTVLPFDLTTGLPDDLGLRMARNTQLVLREESRIGVVQDPAGGSWYVESLTRRLAEEAWLRFREVESAGGMPPALRSGMVADALAETAEARRHAIATRRQPITGVSEFPDLDEEPLDRPLLAGWRESARDAVPVEVPEPGGGRATAAAQSAMAAGAAAASVTAALSRDPTPNERPLSLRRWAQPFESLRSAAEAAADDRGSGPTVFLATMGPVAAHAARAAWTRNLLAAGGLRAIEPGPLHSADDVRTAFERADTTVAVLTSSDEQYAEHAESAARALDEAGAKMVLLAGRPGDDEASWSAAGIDGYAFAGVDTLELLGSIHRALEVNPS